MLHRAFPCRAHCRWGSAFGLGGANESVVSLCIRWVGTVPLVVLGVLLVDLLIYRMFYGWIPGGRRLLMAQSLVLFVVAVPVLGAHIRYWRRLLRNTPKVYCSLALPACYRCGFDLAGILTEDPRARVVCPECGQRQLRCRVPNLRGVVPPVDIRRPLTPAQPLVPRPARDVAASKPLPPGVVVRVIKDEPASASPSIPTLSGDDRSG